MAEFRTELRMQLRRAREQLREAVATGDDFLADALSGRLEQLHRLAATHGVRC